MRLISTHSSLKGLLEIERGEAKAGEDGGRRKIEATLARDPLQRPFFALSSIALTQCTAVHFEAGMVKVEGSGFGRI